MPRTRTHMSPQEIAYLIDQSPMNMGVSGKDWLADPRHEARVVDGNVTLFEQGPGNVLQFHWLYTENRGRRAVSSTREAMRQALANSTATAIYGLIPHDRRDSALMARWIGARYCGDVSTVDGRCKLFLITPDILERVI